MKSSFASAAGILLVVAATTLLFILPGSAMGRELETVQSLEAFRIYGGRSMALSPDGRHVYIGSFRRSFASSRTAPEILTILERDSASGKLSLVEQHLRGEASIFGLESVSSVTLSPDGRHITSLQISPDGRHLYALDLLDSTVTALARSQPSDGELSLVESRRGVPALGGANSVALSPDGRHVFVAAAGEHGLAVLARDPESGVLNYLEGHFEGVDGVDGLEGAHSEPSGYESPLRTR